MLANVKIEQDKERPYKYRLIINDMDFSNCTCGIEIEAGSIPEINITMTGVVPEYAGQAVVNFTTESVMQAAYILRNELLKHDELYDGFLASIESSVRDQKLCGLPFQPEYEIAEKILKRIIGEE